MIHDLKPYPAYKDSGVLWLGQVPAHWEVKRNKLFLEEVNERSEDGAEDLLTVSQYTGVSLRRERLSAEGVLLTNASSLVGYKRVKPGDLVMNIMLAWNGSLGVSAIEGIASPAYCVFRAKKNLEPRFLHYLFRTPLFTGAFKTVSTGVVDSRLRLYPDTLFRLLSVLPPLPEQSAIVRFLDHADRRIQRYIRAKKKLIALLNEQRQAIIHRAVTRGLDPNVRLKPSGVEWLGEVPEHWEVLPIKYCARTISKGTTPSTEGREILESGPVRFIKAENVAGGRIIDKPLCFIDDYTNDLLRRSQLKAGDVLFVIAGATLGKTAIVDGNALPANTNQAVSFVRPNHRIVPGYLALWLTSPRVRELTWLHAVQSAQPNLSMTDLGNFWVPVPPVPEQKGILKSLDDAVLGLNEASVRCQREVELIREFHTRLITDVVTGKLDVREEAARLPEEAEEPEPLDEGEAMGEDEAESEGADLDVLAEEAVA
jgi:type I restriction enzyme S subunit